MKQEKEREQGLRQDDGGVFRVLGGLSGGGEITENRTCHVERPQITLPLTSERFLALKHARKKGRTGGPPVLGGLSSYKFISGGGVSSVV